MGINFQASDDPGTLISFPDLILQKIYGLAAFYGWPEKLPENKVWVRSGSTLNQGGNGTNSASDGLEGEAGYLQKASLWEKSVILDRKPSNECIYHLTVINIIYIYIYI